MERAGRLDGPNQAWEGFTMHSLSYIIASNIRAVEDGYRESVRERNWDKAMRIRNAHPDVITTEFMRSNFMSA